MKALFIPKHMPGIDWKWVQRVAHLFDLSGFTAVEAPLSIPCKRKSCLNLKLMNPYWS